MAASLAGERRVSRPALTKSSASAAAALPRRLASVHWTTHAAKRDEPASLGALRILAVGVYVDVDEGPSPRSAATDPSAKARYAAASASTACESGPLCASRRAAAACSSATGCASRVSLPISASARASAPSASETSPAAFSSARCAAACAAGRLLSSLIACALRSSASADSRFAVPFLSALAAASRAWLASRSSSSSPYTALSPRSHSALASPRSVAEAM